MKNCRKRNVPGDHVLWWEQALLATGAEGNSQLRSRERSTLSCLLAQTISTLTGSQHVDEASNTDFNEMCSAMSRLVAASAVEQSNTQHQRMGSMWFVHRSVSCDAGRSACRVSALKWEAVQGGLVARNTLSTTRPSLPSGLSCLLCVRHIQNLSSHAVLSPSLGLVARVAVPGPTGTKNTDVGGGLTQPHRRVFVPGNKAKLQKTSCLGLYLLGLS